ncbi:EpsG family protein [Leuconostoc gelidum subsp. gelidum]|uniref:EpsG family protein n=1 Tax=Leuconostoc gelidum TaxID=1244 RepID=UPI001CC6675F|nr:EpsG family protein [Leuconostoc gelidum]MBZ5975036.1 EpsG family protein [Leuconostoc gelidum subsp. gelidum]MBZ5978039.1 EpsG family protein [Leuconostoc gelidum subsp. gelidum]
MITVFVVIILLIIGILFPENEKVSFFGWIYLIWLSVNAPQKYLLGDYVVYQYSYNNLITQDSQFEKGYTLLEYLGNFVGLNFETFRQYFVAIGVIILYFGVRRFTKNHSLVLAMYIPTIWVVDIIQMRSFVMMSVMVLGFSLLLCNNLISKILAVTVILLGASIHSSGYLFLIGLVLYLLVKSISNFIKYLTYGAIIGILLLPLLLRSSVFISIISFLGNITGRSALVNNLSDLFMSGTPINLKLIYYFILVLSLTVIVLITKDNQKINDDKTFIVFKVLVGGITILFVGTVLLDVASDYSRLIRHGLLYVYILIAWYFQNVKKNGQITIRQLIIGIATCSLVILVYITSQITWGSDIPMSTPYLLHLTGN